MTPWMQTRQREYQHMFKNRWVSYIEMNDYMNRKTLTLKPVEKWKQCQTLTKQYNYI